MEVMLDIIKEYVIYRIVTLQEKYQEVMQEVFVDMVLEILKELVL